MKSNSRRKRFATTVLVMVVSIAMLTLAMAATASASARGTTALALSTADPHHHTIVVYPNGVDDTSDIQAAFTTCTTNNWVCTVELVKGTYYSDQVYAIGFQGSFVGAGQGRTIVQGLPSMPSPNPEDNTPTTPFWSALPSTSNPWPIQFTFVGGSFTVSGMTLVDTNTAPTAGWNYFGTIYTALYAEIQVSGSRATAAISGVGVVNGPGDWLGFNDVTAIDFGSAPFVQIVGAFSVTLSSFYYVDAAVWFYGLLDATATACFNTVNTSPTPFGSVDVSNSQVRFCGNYATNIPESAGVFAYQGLVLTDLSSYSLYVTDNVFTNINTYADAVALVDFEPTEGLASTLSAVVSGNTFVTDTSCGCYTPENPGYAAIISSYPKSVVISNNVLLGGVSPGIYVVGGPGVVSGNVVPGTYIGVWVDYANGISVLGNVIKNSAEYGIAVTDGSSYNTVAFNVVKGSGAYDLYWDGTGTGNHWTGNVYKTSSPATLP
jgi:parallel beta-helix repeat protein